MELTKDSGIEGQWIPATPAKVIHLKRPAPATSGPNWGFDSVSAGSASGVPSSDTNRGQMSALASARQKMIAEHSNRNKLLLKGKFLLPPNSENGSGQLLPPLAPKPHYISEFPFLNLNSLPEDNMACTVVGQATPPQATPATVDKHRNQRERVHDCLSREIIDLDPETPSFQDLLDDESGQLLQSLADNPVEQCFSNQAESSRIVIYQPHEGARNVAVNSSECHTLQQSEGVNQGIDLNKTPPQKVRRKKHRPKVIREGKPARTPKPATPKLPKTTENPSGKRKYVRKTKDVSLQETPTAPQDAPSSAGLGEVVDHDSRSRNNSVRRSLNFDLDGSQAVDRLSASASTMARQNVFGSQCQEDVTQSSSDVHCSQGQGPVALEDLAGRGTGFDLNCSSKQVGNASVRNPQTPNQPPQPSWQEMFRKKWQHDYERMLKSMNTPQSDGREGGNMKKLDGRPSCQNIPGSIDRHLEDCQHQVASKEKKGHSLVDNAQVSANARFMHANGSGRLSGSHSESSGEACFLDIHKRRRIDNNRKDPIPNSSSSSSPSIPSGWRTIHNMRDAQRLMTLEKCQALKPTVDCDQAERGTSDGRIQDHRLMSTSMKLNDRKTRNCMPPRTPEKAPGYRNGQETESYGPQARVEILITKQKRTKRRSRGKKELHPPVNSMASNANQTENVAAAPRIGCSPIIELEPQKSRMKAAQHGGSPAHGCHNRINYQATTCPGLQSGALVSHRDPIDEIVQKLRHLDINGGHDDIAIQPQNALVPYVGGVGAIVPFEGPFNLVKNRKPRAKVDLDPESHRVWKLLMGKESSEGEEGTCIDKKKWWEEERRVFHGRADSFIARMHLIQGDRRFSRWKGSVVDSVIGVFLTQNVSDHLSSSAFMSLAARFPPQSKGNTKADNIETISRHIVVNGTNRRQGGVSDPEFCGQSSLIVNEFERRDNKEMVNSNDLLESNSGGGIIDYSKESSLEFHEIELGTCRESPDSTLGTAVTVTSCTSAVEGDDRKSLEDVVSSQNSVASSQNSSECPGQTTDRSQPSPPLNFEADELLTGDWINCFSSFRELLEMADGRALNYLKATGNGRILSAEQSGMIDWSAALQIDKSSSIENGGAFLNGPGTSIYSSNSHPYSAQHDFSSLSCAPSSSYCHKNFSTSRFMGRERANVVRNGSSQSYLHPSSFELNKTTINETVGRLYGTCTGSSTNAMDQNENVTSKIPPTDLLGPINNNTDQSKSSRIGAMPFQSERNSCHKREASSKKNVSSKCLNQNDGNAVMFQQREKDAALQMERTRNTVESHAEIHHRGPHKTCSNSDNNNHRSEKFAEGTSEAHLRNEMSTTEKVSAETSNSASKKVKVETEKNTFDWDSLRRRVFQYDAKRERSSDTMDSLDYEALRNADVSEIAHAIRERGMNNILAERIKDFLNRLVRDHGSIDLEWLRDIPPDKAKDYLLSIRGLGLKSVECVRLLTLHHLAFPVDTNVGRICVRLGWVPLQPLPESLQLHLLEMYPMLETIQKYLWPRLCMLDQRTLYELHYQLITFGKVFCTKSKPNCNACPMRGECKHFASAFASARLALPGLEEKHLVSLEVPLSSERSHSMASIPMSLPQLEGSTLSKEQIVPRNCEPIIEEPATPEPEGIEASEIDIEDAFYNDPDEIPTIKLNFEEFTQNLQNYMQENNLGLQDGDMSKALVAISAEAASIPMPKLKNVSRLRTEHQVYELPDTHPLLEGLDTREPDDPCPYLLAIWTPGETAQSTELSTECCDSKDTCKLCDKYTCFRCNSIREAQSQMVRGTLLIPCRTANRGSFPLNGTYFQVNEVFADHDSSRNPIDVPRDWIWNLPRRTVYFGTSVPSIFKGLTTEGIQHCFWRGFVCVRGFDRTSRAPRPLFARLHFSASKVTRNRNAAAAAPREE